MISRLLSGRINNELQGISSYHLKDQFEIIFEIEVQSVLKKTAKVQFFHELGHTFSSKKITNVTVSDSYYLLNKAPSKARVFVVVLALKASVKDITSICNLIIRKIYGESIVRSEILIKRKGFYFAKYVKIPDKKGYLQLVTDKDVGQQVVGHVILSEAIIDGKR